MNTFRNFIFIIAAMLLCVVTNAQEIPFTYTKGGFVKEKITISSADLPRLKSAASFSAKMVIEDMRIGNSKHEPDSVYIKRRVDELNDDNKKKGDKWLKEWEESKSNYLPVFIEGYNAKISKTSVPKITDEGNPEYTIILHPDTITVSNAWIASFLSMHMYIVASKNNSDTIATFNSFTFYAKNLSKKYPGFEESAFFMAGDMLARYFKGYIYQKK